MHSFSERNPFALLSFTVECFPMSESQDRPKGETAREMADAHTHWLVFTLLRRNADLAARETVSQEVKHSLESIENCISAMKSGSYANAEQVIEDCLLHRNVKKCAQKKNSFNEVDVQQEYEKLCSQLSTYEQSDSTSKKSLAQGVFDLEKRISREIALLRQAEKEHEELEKGVDDTMAGDFLSPHAQSFLDAIEEIHNSFYQLISHIAPLLNRLSAPNTGVRASFEDLKRKISHNADRIGKIIEENTGDQEQALWQASAVQLQYSESDLPTQQKIETYVPDSLCAGYLKLYEKLHVLYAMNQTNQLEYNINGAGAFVDEADFIEQVEKNAALMQEYRQLRAQEEHCTLQVSSEIAQRLETSKLWIEQTGMVVKSIINTFRDVSHDRLRHFHLIADYAAAANRLQAKNEEQSVLDSNLLKIVFPPRNSEESEASDEELREWLKKSIESITKRKETISGKISEQEVKLKRILREVQSRKRKSNESQ